MKTGIYCNQEMSNINEEKVVERYNRVSLGLHDPQAIKVNAIARKWNMSINALIRLMIDRFPDEADLPIHYAPLKGKKNG